MNCVDETGKSALQVAFGWLLGHVTSNTASKLMAQYGHVSIQEACKGMRAWAKGQMEQGP